MVGSGTKDRRSDEAKKEVYIIGGGTSVKEILDDPELKKELDTRPLIGCNKAVEHFDCDYMVYFDHGNFMHGAKYASTCDNFKGTIYAPRPVDAAKLRKDVEYFTKSKGIGFTKDNGYCGNCAGVTALTVAVFLGFTKIYMLGMDCNAEGSATHFHNGYNRNDLQYNKDMLTKRMRMFEAFATHFELAGKELKKQRPDVKVFNCSRISLIDPEQEIFPRMHVTGALYA